MRGTGALAITLAVLCCTGPTVVGRDLDAPIQTSQLFYPVAVTESGWRTEITWTFTNPIDEPVYVTNCNGEAPPMLEKWAGGDWIDAWSPIVNLCLSPPIVVPAGSTFTDTLHFFAAYPDSDAGPKLEVPAIEGVYRLVWWPMTEYDGQDGSGSLLPLEQRVSNAFELHL